MNKILVSAKALQELIGEDATVELVNSAVAQLAGRLETRVAARGVNIDRAVEAALKTALDTLQKSAKGSSYQLPQSVIGMIRVAIATELREDIKKLYWGELQRQVREDAEKVITKLKADATQITQDLINKVPAKLEEIVRQMAEREVLALMRGVKS